MTEEEKTNFIEAEKLRNQIVEMQKSYSNIVTPILTACASGKKLEADIVASAKRIVGLSLDDLYLNTAPIVEGKTPSAVRENENNIAASAALEKEENK